MIYIVCVSCSSALRVMGDFEEINYLIGPACDWYPSRYPCWREDCEGKGQYVERIEAGDLVRLDVRDLTPHEAFLAINKMGFPEERDCSAAAVQLLFEAFSVKRVEVKQIRGSHRSIIDHIEMSNGAKIYLAACHEGAIVYRIAKPHSYTEAHEADTRTQA